MENEQGTEHDKKPSELHDPKSVTLSELYGSGKSNGGQVDENEVFDLLSDASNN